jgi:hypothetical protein
VFIKGAISGLRDRERGRVGGKIKWRLSEVNARAVSSGQDKLVGKFKMAVGNVISIRGGRFWSTHTFQQELKGSW